MSAERSRRRYLTMLAGAGFVAVLSLWSAAPGSNPFLAVPLVLPAVVVCHRRLAGQLRSRQAYGGAEAFFTCAATIAVIAWITALAILLPVLAVSAL